MTNHDNMIPTVFAKDGAVYANSRDVAAFFEKRHDHVLNDIDRLLPDMREQGWFLETEVAAKTGFGTRSYRAYNLTRDGFTLLAMGFTGPKALKFKIAYISAFNAMEAELRNRMPSLPVVPDSRDMEFVRLAKHVKGDRFASALWDDMGFYCPAGFEPIRQRNLFETANQNITIAITHAA